MTPRRVLIIILFITFLAVFLSIPNDYPIKLKIGSLIIDRVYTSPKIDLSSFGVKFTKEPKTVMGLDIAGGAHLVYEADVSKIAQSDIQTALDATRNTIEKRINLFGVTEPNIQTARSGESYRVVVELPGVTEVEKAKELIGRTAQLDFREFIASEQASISAEFVYPTLLNTKESGLTGKFLKKAEVTFDQKDGLPAVSLLFNDEGAKLFEEITKRNVGKQMPVFLDGLPVTNPRVNEVISGGNAVISGQFTTDGAKELAIQLNSGALPVPIKIISEETIGPSLGQQSVNDSVTAGMIGLFMVMIFMIAYYGRLGLLADVGLFIYAVITLAIFRMVPITLTLPGIAGFILSIGMATDANILIFERIKEELRSGKQWQAAMEVGFGRAWDSIRDANVTTLITCFILFNPLNWDFLPQFGLARGFAATLAIGIFVGLFTGIVVTRTLIRVFIKDYKIKPVDKKEKAQPSSSGLTRGSL